MKPIYYFPNQMTCYSFSDMGRLCLKAGLESEGFLSSEADKWKPDHPARGTDVISGKPHRNTAYGWLFLFSASLFLLKMTFYVLFLFMVYLEFNYSVDRLISLFPNSWQVLHCSP